MEEDDAYIEHIESDEIKKLVEKIYLSKPEKIHVPSPQQHDYDTIIEKIDEINLDKPNRKYGLFEK
jgi:hypothetical protein